MTIYSSVVWSQGLFLRPEHFQQQSRFHESQRRRHIFATNVHGWGIDKLSFKPPNSTPGTLEVSHISGILPNGVCFCSTQDNISPTPIHLAENTKDLIVFVAMPKIDDGTVSISMDPLDDENHPYSKRNYSATDVTTKENSSDKSVIDSTIDVAEVRLKLITDIKLLDTMDSIPIARISRISASGAAILDEEYIPTCVCASASPYLVKSRALLFDRLTNTLKKINTFLTKSNQEGYSDQFNIDAAYNGHPGDFIFIQLSILTSELYRLDESHSYHPYRYYELVSKLHDFICSVQLLPTEDFLQNRYQHLNISNVFSSLLSSIYEGLDELPSRLESLTHLNSSKSELREEENQKQRNNSDETSQKRKTTKKRGPLIVPLKDEDK